MAQTVHGRQAGTPLQPQQPQQPGQQPGQPQQPMQNQQQPVPTSLLIGVAVQAALYWSNDDPARPAWSAEAEQALRGIFEQMPQRV